MAREVLDLYIEQGYAEDITLDFNLSDGTDLESDYNAYFYNANIGTKQFSIVGSAYYLQLTSEDTGKLVDNLEPYTVYSIKISNGVKDKLLTGRIVLNKE